MELARSFLSDRFMSETIPTLRARRLETKLGIDGRVIAFDRGGELIGEIEVVIVWANRLPSDAVAGTTNVIGTDGDLHGRVGELTVKAGDLFMIEGNAAEITIAAKDVNGVAVAGFRMSSGG